MIGTIVPPPPIPAQLQQKIHRLVKNIPTHSYGSIGQIFLWAQIPVKLVVVVFITV